MTTYWRGVKLCQVVRNGVCLGYEANCYIASHKGGRRCTRTRAFAAHGGAETVLRLLKHWALKGHACDTYVDHQLVPDPPLDEVPPIAELEAVEVTLKPCADVYYKRLKDQTT